MHVEGVLANNDYILNGCYIEITSNCNLRCIHCYNESGELRDQISVEAFKNVLGCYDNPKKASITLSGGEPLLHPQVWKFIDMMLESGILARNILLITNATCITDDVANMLAEKHVSVQVSLNGSRAELHDSICGKGNFERTMAGLQRLLSKHANMVIVRNMMNKQNMNDNWDMFCEKLIDMGVHKIMLAGLKKVGRANENLEKIALTPLEYQSLIDRLKESKVITGINDEYRKLAGDEAESNIRIDIPVPYSGVCPYVYQDENPVPISPRIATNGDVYLCQSFMDQRYCLGNINKDSLPHALFNENFINLVNFMTTGRFYMDDCNKCVLKYQCPRGCIPPCCRSMTGCGARKSSGGRKPSCKFPDLKTRPDECKSSSGLFCCSSSGQKRGKTMIVVECLYTSNEIEEETILREQQKRCLAAAASYGWAVRREVFEPLQLSARGMDDRTGIQTILDDVCNRRFDLLMIASMDRLSYDKEEVKAFLAEMDLNGISIFNVGSNTVTLASGWDLMAFIRQMISPENGGDAQ
mgnify:CR=1 FL=1